MAIIIPSSHIYDIKDSQVNNNKIDKIEIHANKEIVGENYGQNVFSDEIEVSNSDLVDEGERTIDKTGSFICTSISGNTFYNTNVAYVYAECNGFKKYTKRIAIKKSENNTFIESLVLGKNAYGEANIDVSFIGDITTTAIAANMGATIESSGNNTYYITFTNPIFNEGESQIEQNTAYTLPENIEVAAENSYGGFNPTRPINPETLSASVELPISDYSNLKTVEATSDDNYFYLDLKIIPSVEIYKASFISNHGEDRILSETFTFDVTGTKTTYTPKKVLISVLGNVLTLNVQEDLITVGNGNNVFSVENNELLQSDSYLLPQENKALETMYADTLMQYKNGKETATILCDIGNYFTETNVMYVSDSLQEQETQDIPVMIHGLVDWEFYFSIEETQNRDIKVYYTYTENNETISDWAIISKGQKSEITFLENWRSKNVQISAVKIVPEMVFAIGDEVMPMAYGANRQDYPMSRQKDGTAKKFKVLGSRVFYDGAVWQELSMQEI